MPAGPEDVGWFCAACAPVIAARAAAASARKPAAASAAAAAAAADAPAAEYADAARWAAAVEGAPHGPLSRPEQDGAVFALGALHAKERSAVGYQTERWVSDAAHKTATRNRDLGYGMSERKREATAAREDIHTHVRK